MVPLSKLVQWINQSGHEGLAGHLCKTLIRDGWSAALKTLESFLGLQYRNTVFHHLKDATFLYP